VSLINQDTIASLNLFSNLLLVLVTATYVFLTSRMLNQTSTSNKMELIEKRLEKLYYPLLQVLNASERAKLEAPERTVYLLMFGHMGGIYTNKLHSSQHLSRNRSFQMINKVLIMLGPSVYDQVVPLKPDEFINLKYLVEDDIKYFTEMLNKLNDS